MRILIFFDLPTETTEQKRDYRHFRKDLIKNGFIMMQESVYCRMVLNQNVGDSVIDKIKKIKPAQGLIQVLMITEKQFAEIECVVGEYSTDVIDSDKRIIIL